MHDHQQIQQPKNPKPPSSKRIFPANQNHVLNPASIIQRARLNPKSLTSADVLQLQRTIGNRAVGRLISDIRSFSTTQQTPFQRQEIMEEKLQMKPVVQRQGSEEEHLDVDIVEVYPPEKAEEEDLGVDIVETYPTKKDRDLGDIAKQGAQVDTQLYRELSSKMCWDAVIYCAKIAGVIDEARRIDGSHLVSNGDELVNQANSIPIGHVIGFLDGDKLIHATLSIGGGHAAGNKNSCIGIGNPVGWEILDLNALGLRNGTFVVQGSSRNITVRHKHLTQV